jgi:hypothetical protein
VTLLPTLGVPPCLPGGVALVPLAGTAPRRISLIAYRRGAEHPEIVAALREAAARIGGPAGRDFLADTEVFTPAQV